MPFKPTCSTCGKPNDNREMANHCTKCHPLVMAENAIKVSHRKGKQKNPQSREANRESRNMCYKGPSEDNAERMRKIRKKRIDEGMCPYCGKREPEEGFSICNPCRDYHKAKYYEMKKNRHYQIAYRQAYRERMDRKRDAYEKNGLCMRCSLHPAREGHTTCTPCSDRVSAYNKEYNERMKAKYGLDSITQVRKMRKEELCIKREKIESFKDLVSQRSRSASGWGSTTSK